MEERGKDSWGGTSGIEDVRQIGPITSTWASMEPTIATWGRGIFHTRAASQGKVTLANQHPFEFDYSIPDSSDPTNPTKTTWVRYVTGIHNGIITNHFDMNRKYDRKFEVDSMHIYAHLAARLPTSELQGWGALAWYEYTNSHPNGRLHLLRFNSDNLHMYRLESGELVFASTSESLRRAIHMSGGVVKHPIKIDEEKIYTVEDVDGEDIVYVSSKKFPFGTRGQVATSGNRGTHETFHNIQDFRSSNRSTYHFATAGKERRDAGDCATKGCQNKVEGSRKVNLLCTTCFVGVEKEWREKYVSAN